MLSFRKAEEQKIVTIETNADSWSIENPASDWLDLSGSSGSGGMSNVTLSVTSKTITERTTTLTITAGNTTPGAQIVVSPAIIRIFVQY
ncbi:MAG: hypothetical protein HC831_18885 [Chloroflexia bacterium]|nr:hypothetical protein [Chloroflexia bacterium]